MIYKNAMSWFVWAIALSFFAFQFVLRLLPGLIMNQMMAKMQIDASSYGLLSSMYYFGYACALSCFYWAFFVAIKCSS